MAVRVKLEMMKVPEAPLARHAAWLLGLATLLVFGIGGVVIMQAVQQRSVLEALTLGYGIWQHLGLGLLAGMTIGLAARALLRLRSMRHLRSRYAGLIAPLLPHRWQRVWVSLCAGVGEELFFRGALQHWLGIPLTAVVFVAIHGYLDPRDRHLFLYGAFMTMAMMGLGWMARGVGLLAPMVAHAVIDILLLATLVNVARSTE